MWTDHERHAVCICMCRDHVRHAVSICMWTNRVRHAVCICMWTNHVLHAVCISTPSASKRFNAKIALFWRVHLSLNGRISSFVNFSTAFVSSFPYLYAAQIVCRQDISRNELMTAVLDSPTISCQFHGSPCEEALPNGSQTFEGNFHIFCTALLSCGRLTIARASSRVRAAELLSLDRRLRIVAIHMTYTQPIFTVSPTLDTMKTSR